MKVGLMTCYDLRAPELALAQALQGAEILVFLPPGFAGRSKSITGQRCLPLVRWIPLVIWWRRGSAGTKYRSKPDYRSLWRHVAAASEMPALIMAEVTPERVRQVRAQLPVLNNRRFAPPQLL